LLTTEQIDNWFTYHAPTEETAPKYADLRRAEKVFRDVLLFSVVPKLKEPVLCFSMITSAARDLIQSINYNAPDCDDKTAAIRCVRLARNAANEFVMTMNGDGVIEEMANMLLQVALEEALKARWQACSAIACGGR
jgi:hypothetical protein